MARRRDPHPGIDHADYLMPGAFILTVTASAVTTTGVGFAEDLVGGAIDRFRSLPIARSAVLAARMLSDAVRLLLLIALMTAVGSRSVSASTPGSCPRWPRSRSRSASVSRSAG